MKSTPAAIIGLLVCAIYPVDALADPLPSWNDTTPKKALIAFVERVTRDGGDGYVPPNERIAVFDNDGTLWPENPMPFQLAFSIDELKRQLPDHPEWKDDTAIQSALKGDMSALLADHHKGLSHIVGVTSAGITTSRFAENVQAWLATTKHPRFARSYDDLTYKPMQEVMTYLRANGFKTFIVSGGGADFMRVFSERVYGITPEQIVGSNTRAVYELRDGSPVLVKTMDHLFFDDKEAKPAGIHQFIGRRPIACFGNSDGDKAMLEYTTINNPRPSLGMIIHHTDADREYAYDAKPSSSGKLVEAIAEAPDRGWLVVDMAKDWREIFAPSTER
jgi:hypothetical protein